MAHQATIDFCDRLFAAAPEHLWTHLWSIPGKRSHWFQVGDGTAKIVERAEALAENLQVYISVSLAREKGGQFKRIMADSSAGIMGLWADIDIADPDVHKKWNLPPDEGSARELLSSVGLEPTILVHSGHGLQAWWLFEEFWQFDGEEDRVEAANLAQAWNTTLRVRAAERNWTVDSTYDLSRVLRLPGTVNRKIEDEPVEARLLSVLDAGYGRADLDERCVDERLLQELGLTPTREYVVGELVLKPNAAPPADKWDMLTEIEPKAILSHRRKRRDLQDQSPSSYDLSLASFAAQVDWSDQEIADLIIFSRRTNKEDLDKVIGRQDYLKRTIARARDQIGRDKAVQEMDTVTDQFKSARRTGDDDEVKMAAREMLESISQQLTIEVVKILRYNSTPPTWRMVTPIGEFDLGTAADIISWSRCKTKIVEGTNQQIPRMKPAQWDRLTQMIFDVAEVVDTGIESTEAGQVYLWVSEYLMTHEPVTDREDAAVTEYPYLDADSGLVCIFSTHFSRWLYVHRNERTKPRELSRMLTNYGAESYKLNVTISGRKTTKSVWRMHLPREYPGG